jgi:hypothetical protein
VNWLNAEHRARTLRWGWLLWLAWLVAASALLLDDLRSGTLTIGLVLTAPFWALWVLWPAYIAWWFVRRWRARGALLGDWQGQYYEFDGHQVRVLARGDSVLFVAVDVFEALSIDEDARRTGRVRQIAGRDGLATDRATGFLCFSEKGLEAWLDRRNDLAVQKFRFWRDKQVIEPYRRRRELDERVS